MKSPTSRQREYQPARTFDSFDVRNFADKKQTIKTDIGDIDAKGFEVELKIRSRSREPTFHFDETQYQLIER